VSKTRLYLLGLCLLLLQPKAGLMAQASANQNSPTRQPNLVTKEYPDGTRQVIRWVDLGAGEIDRGEKHGGAPKIVPFDPNRDGLVPIGQTSDLAKQSSPGPVASAQQPVANRKPVETYQPDMLYARFQVGLTIPNDQTIIGVYGNSTSTNLTFDPGIRGMIEVGGDLMEYLALEGNFGVAWNSCNQGDTAALYQIPAMIGLVGKYPIQLQDGPKLTPYFGIDGGINALIYDSLNFIPQGQSNDYYYGSPSYLTAAWQIRLGVMVELQEKWSLVAGYSYLGSWGNLGTSSDLNLGFLGTSTLELGFQAKF